MARLEGVALAVCAIAGALLAFGCIYPASGHLIEAPPVYALADPTLFSTDFAVRDFSDHFTPRFYSQYCVLALMKCGFDLPHALFIMYATGIAAFVTGLRAIGLQIFNSRAAAVMLVFWGFTVAGTNLGGTQLILNAAVPGVYAMGIAVWGIYFALQRRWVPAFGLLGMACLFQFLVGVLAALFCMPFLLHDAAQHRRWLAAALALVLLGIGAGAVYLPMALSGGTSTSAYTNAEFVHLYGHVREPHHILPSAWPLFHWLDGVIFFGGALALLARCSKGHFLKKVVPAAVAILTLLLLVNYVFVEIVPLAIVAKLQFGRAVPLTVLAGILGMALAFQEQWAAKRYFICGIIAAAPLAPFGGLLLGLIALAWPRLEELCESMRPAVSAAVGVVVFGVILAFVNPAELESQPAAVWSTHQAHWAWAAALIALVSLPEIINAVVVSVMLRRALLVAAAVVMTIWVGVASFSTGLQSLPRLASGRINLADVESDQITRLAEKFRLASSKDALLVIPPSLVQMRLMSMRSVLVDSKAFPHTDAGIVEWQRRMEALLGAPLPDDVTNTSEGDPYYDRPATELLAVARKFHATHVLTNTELQRDIPGPVVAREGTKWVIWQVPTEAPPP